MTPRRWLSVAADEVARPGVGDGALRGKADVAVDTGRRFPDGSARSELARGQAPVGKHT